MLHKTFKLIVDSIYPPHCLTCSAKIEEANNFCGRCWNNITFISKPYCINCALPLPISYGNDEICYICQESKPLFDMARSVFRYDIYTKSLIHDFKFNDKGHAINSFANLMSLYGQELIELADLIIPIPLTKSKLAKRQFNQSVLLAKPIAYNNKKLLSFNILNKIIETSTQTTLKKAERQQNLEIAFKCSNSDLIKNKNVLIIDDVLTTGATANACSKILKQSGAAKVFILTLARTY